MTAALKRIVYLVGWLPVSVYAALRWIATGRDPEYVLDAFALWCDV